MPKSRRDKVVALTQTKKKDREWKGGLIESVREALGTYASVYVFRCANLRNNTFKDLKADLRDTSRFFMGSNKVLQVALGKGPEDEQSDNLHKVSEHVKGHAGLVFTNLTKEDLESAMAKYETNDFRAHGRRRARDCDDREGPGARRARRFDGTHPRADAAEERHAHETQPGRDRVARGPRRVQGGRLHLAARRDLAPALRPRTRRVQDGPAVRMGTRHPSAFESVPFVRSFHQTAFLVRSRPRTGDANAFGNDDNSLWVA
jgi:hypothetical protein